MKKLPVTLLLLAALAVFLSAGCARKDNAVKIGIAGPMTGDQSKMGADFRNGATLAVEEWNSRGGVLGKKVMLLVGPA